MDLFSEMFFYPERGACGGVGGCNGLSPSFGFSMGGGSTFVYVPPGMGELYGTTRIWDGDLESDSSSDYEHEYVRTAQSRTLAAALFRVMCLSD